MFFNVSILSGFEGLKKKKLIIKKDQSEDLLRQIGLSQRILFNLSSETTSSEKFLSTIKCRDNINCFLELKKKAKHGNCLGKILRVE